MSAVVLVVLALSLWWVSTRSFRAAYLDVYLVSLFLLPGWCRFVVPSLPDPTFHEAALLPIAAAFFFKSRKGWKFSPTDALVVAFAAVIGYSEFVNAGYKEAQNLMFDMVAAGVLPYLLAKGIVEPYGMRVQVARRIVCLLSIVSLLCAYEFRFAYSPFRLVFDRFFPGQGDGWVTTFRNGFARSAGPFGHAILAGIVFLIGFRLQRWLEHSGAWERNFRKFRIGSLSKARVLSIALFAGLAMTMVRGPQIGAVLASIVALIGKGVNPRRRAYYVLVAIIAVGIPAGVAAYSYASVGRAAAKDANQESAAYRKELIDKYVDIAVDHAVLGWGRNGWPKIPGMPSIDNYYLLLALMHGVTASGLLVALLSWMAARLLRNGIAAGPARPKGSSFSFTMAGIFVGIAFSIFTVYLGDNTIPILFTLIGIAEGYLLNGGDLRKRTESQEAATVFRPRFQVVLA